MQLTSSYPESAGLNIISPRYHFPFHVTKDPMSSGRATTGPLFVARLTVGSMRSIAVQDPVVVQSRKPETVISCVGWNRATGELVPASKTPHSPVAPIRFSAVVSSAILTGCLAPLWYP